MNRRNFFAKAAAFVAGTVFGLRENKSPKWEGLKKGLTVIRLEEKWVTVRYNDIRKRMLPAQHLISTKEFLYG